MLRLVLVLALIAHASVMAQETSTARGRVLDARTGAPVKGARVKAPGEASVRTDASGRFEITRLTGNLLLHITKPGFASGTFVAGTAPGELVVRMRRGGTLIVRVLDEFNEPKRGTVAITADPRSTGVMMALQGSLDERGEFRAPNLAPGRYDVRLGGALGQLLRLRSDLTITDVPQLRAEIARLAASAAATANPTHLTVDVPEGDETALILVDATPPPDRPVIAVTPGTATMIAEGQVSGRTGTASIRGRVILPDGRPISGVAVAINGSGASAVITSDRDGMYEITGLPAGTFTVSGRKRGFTLVSVGGSAGAGTIALGEGDQLAVNAVLSQASSVSGAILDEYGEPVYRARLLLLAVPSSADAGPPRPVVLTFTNERGAFEIRGVPPGLYYAFTDGEPTDPGEVHLFHPGRLSLAEAEPVQVEDGLDLQGLTLRLDRTLGTRVSGVVLDAKGLPMPGRGVEIAGSDASGAPVIRRASRTTRSGAFEFLNVSPGEYEIALQRATTPAALIPSLLGFTPTPPDQASGRIAVRVGNSPPPAVTLRADP